MIKNFDAVKEQLKELAEIVNSFKSEAVQLRLVDLVLGGGLSQQEPAKPASRASAASERTRPRRQKLPAGTSDPGASQVGRGRTTRLGGKAVLARLYGEGFFKNAKTINDVVQHADTKLATKLKQSDLSGGLARYVRDGKLNRQKNADSQYEYVQA